MVLFRSRKTYFIENKIQPEMLNSNRTGGNILAKGFREIKPSPSFSTLYLQYKIARLKEPERLVAVTMAAFK